MTLLKLLNKLLNELKRSEEPAAKQLINELQHKLDTSKHYLNGNYKKYGDKATI